MIRAFPARPWYVVANKMDLPGAAENLRALEQRFPDLEIVAISAERSDGVAELRTQLERWLSNEVEESPSQKWLRPRRRGRRITGGQRAIPQGQSRFSWVNQL